MPGRNLRARRHGDAIQVINDLNIDMVQRAVHIQARTLSRAQHLAPDARMHRLPVLIALCLRDHFLFFFLSADSRPQCFRVITASAARPV